MTVDDAGGSSVGVCEAKILSWLKDCECGSDSTSLILICSCATDEMQPYTNRFNSIAVEREFHPWFTSSVTLKLRMGCRFVGCVGFFLAFGQLMYGIGYGNVSYYYSAAANTVCGFVLFAVAYFIKRKKRTFVRNHQMIMTTVSVIMSFWMYLLSALPSDNTIYLWRCSVFHGAVRGIILAFASLNIVGFTVFTIIDEVMFLVLMLEIRPNEEVLALPYPFAATEFVLAFCFLFFAREVDLAARRAFMRDRLRMWHGDHIANQLKTLESDQKKAKKINQKQQVMVSYAHVDKDFAKKFVKTLNAQASDISLWIDDSGLGQSGNIQAGT
jgi:hypothetical protein